MSLTADRWGVLLTLVLSLALAGIAQDFQINAASDGRADSGYWTQWDSTHYRAFMYRDISSPDLPAARVFHADGSSAAIYPLRDFREAKFADVWAGAATPQGGIVMRVVLGYGDRPNPKDPSTPFPPIKSLILTYDSYGKLKKVWNVAPYAHVALAVDPDGNVFALGSREAGPAGFPMLIKYSPDGKVTGEYMPSTLFASGAKALAGNGLNGGPSLHIRNQKLAVWLPSQREVYLYSLNGELRRKIALGQALDQFAHQNGYVQATVAGLSLTDSSDVAVQVRLWRTLTSADGLAVGMATVPSDGSPGTLSEVSTPTRGTAQQFLGISEDGKPVFLELPTKDQAFVRKH